MTIRDIENFRNGTLGAGLERVESGARTRIRVALPPVDGPRPAKGPGRRTEIDFINGVIVDRGKALGLPTRTHERLIAAVKQVELGKAALIYAIR